jgi:hypothetical protein
MERTHRAWIERKVRKARYISLFTEVAEKGREAFHRERECPEAKSKMLDLEDIFWMGESGFAGWIGAKKNGGRTSQMMKSTIALRVVLSISTHIPDKRRFRVRDCFRFIIN